MRTQITVTDLSLKQCDWLQTQLGREHEVPVGAARVCVQFELGLEFSPIHVEMPARKLARVLDMLEHSSLMEAALSPDTLSDEPVSESAEADDQDDQDDQELLDSVPRNRSLERPDGC